MVHETVEVPYREAIGSLNHVLIGSRLDIAYAMGVVASYAAEPKRVHWKAVKCIISYLRGTANLGLMFSSDREEAYVECYSDASFASDVDTRRSTAGYVVLCNGTPVIWRSTKEKQTAVSTTEAEFIATSLACRELLWTRQLLSELQIAQQTATPMYIDNQGAIALIRNPQTHARTKHINVLYMFVREAHARREIDATFVPAHDQLADALTKGLPRCKFNPLVTRLHVI